MLAPDVLHPLALLGTVVVGAAATDLGRDIGADRLEPLGEPAGQVDEQLCRRLGVGHRPMRGAVVTSEDETHQAASL